METPLSWTNTPSDRTQHQTGLLEQPVQPGFNDTYFGPKSTLVLKIKGSEVVFEVQPQQHDNLVVIGRQDGSRTGLVDVDVCCHSGGQLGVSRQHVMITYNPHMQILTVTDLRSTNGTWVNGQRLVPGAGQIVRHGDELRVGKIKLAVTLLHAFNEIDLD